MNEKFNKNAKVEKFTGMLGIVVCLIVIDSSKQEFVLLLHEHFFPNEEYFGYKLS